MGTVTIDSSVLNMNTCVHQRSHGETKLLRKCQKKKQKSLRSDSRWSRTNRYRHSRCLARWSLTGSFSSSAPWATSRCMGWFLYIYIYIFYTVFEIGWKSWRKVHLVVDGFFDWGMCTCVIWDSDLSLSFGFTQAVRKTLFFLFLFYCLSLFYVVCLQVCLMCLLPSSPGHSGKGDVLSQWGFSCLNKIYE